MYSVCNPLTPYDVKEGGGGHVLRLSKRCPERPARILTVRAQDGHKMVNNNEKAFLISLFERLVCEETASEAQTIW